MSEKERVEILEHCRWVDEVVCPCPWIINIDFLRKHNIHYVAHDDLPYNSAGSQDIYYDVKKLGMFRATQRTDGISTSDIILRLIKDYDMYVERSFQRGYNRKDLGVSATKAFRIKLRQRIKRFREKFIKQNEQPEDSRNRSAVSKLFKKLENYTEKLWHDYNKQFSNKMSIADKHIKQVDKSSDEDAEESYEEEAFEPVPQKPEPPKTFWGKLWRSFMDNFDLTQK